jgi:hypothetical protein
MRLIASPRVLRKLKNKHQVSLGEIEECFSNQTKSFLEDTRTKNLTLPPTMWFDSQTDRQRVLKVVFIEQQIGLYELKTAYRPSREEERIYDKYAKTL